MKKYRIKNWNQFQHYKATRSAPWIKLHKQILNSSDWVCATDAQRLHMVCCLLVGALHGGCVPSDALVIKRVCHLNWRVEFEPLIRLGFLEEVLADDSAILANDRIEKRREEKIATSASASTLSPDSSERSEGKSKENRAAPPRKRKTLLPMLWVPSQAVMDWAAGKNLHADVVARELERFKSKALANGYAYINWDSAFRNWLDSPYGPIARGDANVVPISKIRGLV